MERVWLPNLLRDMAEVHGLPVALAFARRFGGRYLYLPASATAEHPVARAFGIEMLEWLLTRDYHQPGTRITVPQGPDADRAQQLRALRSLAARPLTVDQMAGETGLHVRTVHRWLAKFREEQESRQMNLFPPPSSGAS
ncbi:hypothetical protein [Falsiroseomonas sp.]|uniref:hypothetical protein n=1 Tax=Falsiroseomonas sp. TaxID=2870721 RepID=UPI003F6F4F33